MTIEVKNISKTFGNARALKNVNLTIQEGELLALLGPSGCGKTTLLRVIAGLELPDPHPDSGVYFDEQDMSSEHVGQRKVGFVFQHYALFRHMTVEQNIGFGLSVRPRSTRPGKALIREKVHELLRLIQLENLGQRYPDQLSGGQRQRVALARALAVEPRVLLLDEPFGALDAHIRKELRQWLRRLHDEIHVTSVFVTHDQEEALEVSDRVVVMHQGQIEQIGTPEEVYHHPANETVCKFLGDVNLFKGRVGGAGVSLAAPDAPHGESGWEEIYVRPHAVKLHAVSPGPDALSAVVEHVNPARSVVRVSLRTAGGDAIEAEITHSDHRALGLEHGREVYVSVDQYEYFGNGAGI